MDFKKLKTIILISGLGLGKQVFSQTDYQFNSYIGLGFRGIPETREAFPKLQLSTGITKNFTWWQYRLELQGFYSQNIQTYQGLAEHNQRWTIGLCALGVLKMDNLHFLFGLGPYLHGSSRANVWMYSQLGFNYYLHPSIYLGWVFKAHRHEADFMNFGIGFAF